MALPKLNGTPKYEMKIPSTGQVVAYRPFLVKEEKVLMIALESDNKNQMLNAIIDTLKACIITEFNAQDLTVFDIEYLFTKLRTKSVGESTTLSITCDNSDCNHDNEVLVNLDDIEVNIPKISNKIKLNDEYTLEVKWPDYRVITQVEDEKLTTETTFKMIKSCLVTLYTEDTRHDLSEESDEELQDFIDSMNREQFAKIQEFIEKMPTVEKKINFTCSNCGTQHEKIIKGMQNFF